MAHFPAVGHVYEANFGSRVFHLHFHSETEMTLTNVQGSFKGVFETVQITVTTIRRSIFLICWQEADKTTVVHLYAFKNGMVYTHVTEPNNVFFHTRGTLKQVR